MVCRRLGLDSQALDRLEDMQIIVAVRRPGRERAYSASDVDRLRVYAVLVHELDVNPAGAEIILRMRSRLLTVRTRLAQMFDQARAHGLLDELHQILDSLEEEL
jgi:DNA-binding transcriptional MerR regulator